MFSGFGKPAQLIDLRVPDADKILVISYDKNVGEKAKKILVKANVRIITVGHQE